MQINYALLLHIRKECSKYVYVYQSFQMQSNRVPSKDKVPRDFMMKDYKAGTSR